MNWISLATLIILTVSAGAALAMLYSMRKAVRSQAYSSITSHLHALDKLVLHDPSLDKLLDNGSPKKEDDEVKQRWLVLMYLDLYENAHFQRKEGVIPKKLWPGWKEEIRQTCRRQGFKNQYDTLKNTIL